MSKRVGAYPRVRLEGGGSGVVSQAGAVLLVETVRKVGLCTALSAAMAPWRKPWTVHDVGKVLLDVAPATALGGGCLADVAMPPGRARHVRPGGMIGPHGLPAHRHRRLRKERPRPGAQSRFTDLDGLRRTCFATNTKGGRLADLEDATADGHAARTASEVPAPSACATCPCTTRPRTGSGWRSSRSHSPSSPGCPCSP